MNIQELVEETHDIDLLPPGEDREACQSYLRMHDREGRHSLMFEIMDSIREEFQHLEIKLEDIKLATNNFDKAKVIGYGGFGDVFEAEMSHSKGQSMVAIKRLVRRHGQGDPEFLKEISTLSRYSHTNLITLIGFCDHGDEKVLVYEHAARGSLDLHLSSPALTWTRRIKICLDAAKGLGYLHDPRETHQRVLHRDIKSSNILIDAGWNAKISDMGLSKVGPANQLHTALFTNVAGTPGYCDPQYFKSYILTKESDVYSFGVVLFEVFCGKLCYKKSKTGIEILVPKWKQSYQENKLDTIIFQVSGRPINPAAMDTFSRIAFQCLQKSRERPLMSRVVQQLEMALELQGPDDLSLQNDEIIPLTNRFKVDLNKLPAPFRLELEHLHIRLQDIISATNNFDATKLIGVGGFGKVYKGEVSHYKGRSMAAFKRLDRALEQGGDGFIKELLLLSHYMHPNLISILGFCVEHGEMILAFEFASNGSLDRLLNAPTLTWTQRLHICLDAAKGLNYLHDPTEAHRGLVHCDMKSSNILLDDRWNAKVADFVLSKIGNANQLNTFIIDTLIGTIGYCDPQYMMTYNLTKESDVYSFGVVLFEVLCGRLCFDFINSEPKIHVHMWKKSYQENKLEDIIFKDLLQKMDPTSLETFSDIAFHCLNFSREERPMMSVVVEKLEIALKFQESYDIQLREYEAILKAIVPPLGYRSVAELNQILSSGVYLYGGKTWFSLNENEEHCEMISIAECLIPGANENHILQYSFEHNSRFSAGCYETCGKKFKTHIRTRLLSPLITYNVNFVFKFKYGKKERKEQCIALRYRLEGETKTWILYLADEKLEDEWLVAELYQFTSDGATVDLDIIFEENSEWLVVEGIEFQPVKKVEHEVLDDEKLDMQTGSDQDTYWEQKLPNDYQDIIKWSKDDVKWTTNKELYSILCKGFLIHDHQEWFFLDKNGKKCLMLSPRVATVICKQDLTCQSSPESRFGEAMVIEYDYTLRLHADIRSQVLSSQTSYATYLVYKLPQDQSKCEAPVEVTYEDNVTPDDRKLGHSWYICLVTRQIPVIFNEKLSQNTMTPVNRTKVKRLPQQRTDGLTEVQIWEFWTSVTTEMIPMRLSLFGHNAIWLHGITLHGIEFRPI